MPRNVWTRRLCGWSSVLLLLLTACTPTATGPSASAGGSAARPIGGGPSGVYPKHPKPLPAATVKAGASRAVTTHASWQTGTSITAKGRDGTTYTLTVPEGALLSDVDITMTPITGLAKAPVSGGVGGVHLTPHGLVFQQPVTLTVTPKGGVPRSTAGSRTAVLAAGSDGAELHGYGLATLGDTTVTLWLSHFSLYYVGTFSPGDLETILLHVPTATDGQLAQDMFGGEDPVAVFTAWYNDVVEPALRAAEADLDLAEDATRVALGWLRLVALMGWNSTLRSSSR
nr:hypothetical protein [Propionicimonas sp.]